MNKFKYYLAGLAAVLLMANAMAAEKIPAIPDIPTDVATSHAELAMQRAALLQERASLKARIAMNKIECESVKQYSPEDAKCTQDTTAISADVDRHVQTTEQFITSINDPMVVNTQDIPSGLPKGLDSAIASVYAKAPTGVSERVRKGFQAVMVRDWPVAKAWFQDALNHDPGNAGLKSLIAITDTPQLPDLPPAKVDIRNEPAGLGGRLDVNEAAPKYIKPDSTSSGMKDSQQADSKNALIHFPGLKAMNEQEAVDYIFGLYGYPAAKSPGK